LGRQLEANSLGCEQKGETDCGSQNPKRIESEEEEEELNKVLVVLGEEG
jgi:hypothetical protein